MDFEAFLLTASGGSLQSFSRALGDLVSTSDFWLWAYVLFTISNTMMPEEGSLSGWPWVAAAVAAVSAPLFLLGVGEQIVGGAVMGPVADGLNTLSMIFASVILIDLIAVGILAVIENMIEFVTGDSATFKNGKMIVMRREEVIAQRRQERRRRRARQRRQAASSNAGPTLSVYALSFPVPGPPGDEPVTAGATSILEPADSPRLSQGPRIRPPRDTPTLITPPGEPTRDQEQARGVSAQQPSRQARRQLPAPANDDATEDQLIGADDAQDAKSDGQAVVKSATPGPTISDSAEPGDDGEMDPLVYEDFEDPA